MPYSVYCFIISLIKPYALLHAGSPSSLFVSLSILNFSPKISSNLLSLSTGIFQILGPGLASCHCLSRQSFVSLTDDHIQVFVSLTKDPLLPVPSEIQVTCLKTYFGHSSFKP